MGPDRSGKRRGKGRVVGEKSSKTRCTVMGKILGIDLGTTNSVMAVWDGREPRLIVSEQGSRLTPSVVGFGANGDVFVGEVARRQAVANAHRTVFSVKRFVGQRYTDVTTDRGAVPYEVVAGKEGEVLIQMGERNFSPEEISAHVLKELKRSAEAFLGEPVDGAVITVPAYFNDAQRTATKEAGRLAGLDVRRIINEPTAAALAYGFDKAKDKVIAVYDFGGGTFDVSVLSIGDDVIEVIATHGDTHLGGDDIDARIVKWLIEKFESSAGVGVDGDAAAIQRLREAAERAKIDLSSRTSTEINLPFLAANDEGPQHLEAVLTRDELESLIGDLVDRTLASCVQVLSDARKQPGEIDEVVLVGGSSRIPLVQTRVSAYFRKEPRRTVNPDEVVALGAAVQAGVIAGEVKGLVLLDVTSLSLGVETHDGLAAVVIPRNTTIPTESMRTFTTAADSQTSVEVHVVQGEAERARQNDSLGRFDLDGLKAAPAGATQIDVTFSIDLNGMVKVSASDRATGRSQTVSVSARAAVTREPALRDAKAREPELRAKSDSGSVPSSTWGEPAPAEVVQEEVPLPSAAQAALKEAEQLLGQHADKLAGVERSSLQSTSEQLRAAMKTKAAPEELEKSRSALRQVIARVKEALLARRGR